MEIGGIILYGGRTWEVVGGVDDGGQVGGGRGSKLDKTDAH